jgi:hypothetical protein
MKNQLQSTSGNAYASPKHLFETKRGSEREEIQNARSSKGSKFLKQRAVNIS